MRYHYDVVNAENWNKGLKKLGHKKPGAETASAEKQEGTPKTDAKVADVDLQSLETAKILLTKSTPSTADTRTSKPRLKRKRKGMFILSGLLTGLISGSRNRK